MKFRQLIMGNKAARAELATDLHRYGYLTEVNYTLMTRADAIDETMDEVSKLLAENKPIEALDKLNKAIYVAGMPFARAGDKSVIALAIGAWGQLVGVAKKIWDSLIENENDISRNLLAEKFKRLIESDIMSAGFTVLSLCFYDKDVSPQYVNILPTTGSHSSQMVVPRSAVAPEDETL